MNPILAFVLTFFIIHIGMMVAHVTLTVVLALDIAASTGKIWMHYDELDKEIQSRALGRFALSIYPVVFWWLLLWERIVGSDHD